MPCQWDFPTLEPEEYRLPEVKVGRWGGFVFINPDPAAEPLESYLAGLGDHFTLLLYGQRFKAVHVAKVLRCNWKAAQEAFMEAYHVVATHPVILGGIGDANSKYDVFGNFSRAISPNGTPSPHLRGLPPQEPLPDAGFYTKLRHPLSGDVYERGADGLVHVTTKAGRKGHPWGSFNAIVYRFRPYGSDPEMSVHECMFFLPAPPGEKRPRAAPIHWLGPDDDWVDAPELGMLAKVFNQDVYNLPRVQKGLRTMKQPHVIFADYGETKPRHFHKCLDEWLAKP